MYRQFEARRRPLLYTGLAFCAAAAFLAPLAGRSSMEFSAGEPVAVRRFPLPAPSTVSVELQLRTVRDPFAGDDLPVAAPKPSADRGGEVLVRAVISGRSPRALVEERGRLRIVEIGDRVAGTSVKAIGGDRVLLSDGHILLLAGAST